MFTNEMKPFQAVQAARVEIRASQASPGHCTALRCHISSHQHQNHLQHLHQKQVLYYSHLLHCHIMGLIGLYVKALSSTYKKSELMLMKCVRAYSSSCLQITFAYLDPFHRNWLFCSEKLPKNH